MHFYSRQAAVKYARTWAEAQNPIFRNYRSPHGGGDCTNFISQCLLAGGWPMVRPEESRGDMIALIYRGWWADLPLGDNSKSWSSAYHFLYLLKYGDRAFASTLGQMIPGDIVIHYSDRQGGHVMMVTGLVIEPPSRRILLSYHSRDRLDRDFSDIMISDFGTTGYTFWKLKEFF